MTAPSDPALAGTALEEAWASGATRAAWETHRGEPSADGLLLYRKEKPT
jgi:hypothetical protein